MEAIAECCDRGFEGGNRWTTEFGCEMDTDKLKPAHYAWSVGSHSFQTWWQSGILLLYGEVGKLSPFTHH